MRRLALAAAAALAACSVKLEGAPCTSDANCPGEQRCEGAGAGTGQCVTCVPDPNCTANGISCAQNDTAVRTCGTNLSGCRYSDITYCQTPKVCVASGGTATCECPTDGTTVGAGCSLAGEGAVRCDTVTPGIDTCTMVAGCLVWQTSTDCASQGLTCKTPAGQPLCACPDNSGDLFADANSGSASGAAPYPTGVAAPVACRFKSLTDALANAGAGSTVRMTGWTSGSGAVVFSSTSSGETFPLVVNPDVTLTTSDSPPVPANYLIEVDRAGPIRPVLQLDHDTAASGFTVQPAGNGSASEALLVSCTVPGTNAVALSDLVLDGKGLLGAGSPVADGLTLSTQCSVSVQSVVARNAAKAGIRVNTAGLTTSPPAISIAACSMTSNGDSGLVVQADLSNGQLSVSVTGNVVALNSATTPYTDGSATRRGGGVVLWGAVPQTFAFTGNTIYGNSFDQVLVFSSGSWNLSAAACGSSSNTFTCYDTGNGGGWVGLSALGGSAQVTAADNSWAHGTPSAGTDFFQALGSSVNVGTTSCPANTTCP